MQLIREKQELIQTAQNQLEWLTRNEELLSKLPETLNLECMGLSDFDINQPTHDEVIQIIKLFGGRWSKTAQDDRVNYTRDEEVDGRRIRCWYGQPPPHCRIIEEEIAVPAQPAGKRKVRRLECIPAIEQEPTVADIPF